MRFTWLSNAPWTMYGYGQQTALFAPRLTAKGHPVAVIANHGHQGTPLNWNGIQVFGTTFHPWAMDVLHSHSQTFGADAMISFMDLQVMEPPALMPAGAEKPLKWIPWMPVDHITIPPEVANKLPYAAHILTMSKHASKELDAAGIDYSYVPCAVDTKIFRPLDRAECRKTMGFPQNKFVVGMVAANKGLRKAFHQNIMAFAALQKKYGDCVLYLHTLDGVHGGYETSDLTAFCRVLGLSYSHAYNGVEATTDVVFASQYDLSSVGYAAELMSMLYNSMDVYLGVTMGEGFGIPIIEAQACGTPVIVGDWTAMPELVSSGWKVKQQDAEKIFTGGLAFQFLPHPEAIAEKLEAAYQMRGNMDYRKRAHAGGQMYDADKVTEKYWMPALQKIAEKLQERKATRLDKNLSMLRRIEGVPA